MPICHIYISIYVHMYMHKHVYVCILCTHVTDILYSSLILLWLAMLVIDDVANLRMLLWSSLLI
jgi:hypothetical protein